MYIYGHVVQIYQKLIYLHLFTDCFINISPQSSEQTVDRALLKEKVNLGYSTKNIQNLCA